MTVTFMARGAVYEIVRVQDVYRSYNPEAFVYTVFRKGGDMVGSYPTMPIALESARCDAETQYLKSLL